MEAEAVERLRLEGAIRYYGRHLPWCEEGECTCGYEALLERLRDIRESEDADREE